MEGAGRSYANVNLRRVKSDLKLILAKSWGMLYRETELKKQEIRVVPKENSFCAMNVFDIHVSTKLTLLCSPLGKFYTISL